MTHYVYELTNPVGNLPFYIGMTAWPKRRFRQHLAGKCVSTEGMISQLNQQGIKPEMRLLAEFRSRKEAHDYEHAIIAECARSKSPICNKGHGRVPHPNKRNHGAAWSDHERAHVLDLHKGGASFAVIARAMGRSSSSIRHILKPHVVDGSSSMIRSGNWI